MSQLMESEGVALKGLEPDSNFHAKEIAEKLCLIDRHVSFNPSQMLPEDKPMLQLLESITDFLQQHLEAVGEDVWIKVREHLNARLNHEAHELLSKALDVVKWKKNIDVKEITDGFISISRDSISKEKLIESLLFLSSSSIKKNFITKSRSITEKTPDKTSIPLSPTAEGPVSSKAKWKRPSIDLNGFSEIFKTSDISDHHSSPRSSYLLRNIFIEGTEYLKSPVSDDIPEQMTIVSYRNILPFKLILKVKELNIKLPYDLLLKLSAMMISAGDYESAYEIVNTYPKNIWITDFYKVCLVSYTHRVPKHIDDAKRLLHEYENNQIYDIASGVQRYTTTDEKNLMWLLFTSASKEAQWSDCATRYENAKAISADHNNVHLDNAIMEVALVYKEYDYAWLVYESMSRIDSHTCPIVLTVCTYSFMKNLDLNKNNNLLGELKTWEARGWAVFMRWQILSNEMKKRTSHIISKRIMEIAKNSPEEGSRKAKMERIIKELSI